MRHIEKKQEKISDSEHSLRLSHPCKYKPISSGANCADSHAFVSERDSIARAWTSESERDTLRIGKIEGKGGRLKLSQILKPSHAPDIPRIYQPCKERLGGRLKLSQILKPSHAPDIPRIYQPCKKSMGGLLKLSQILKPSHARNIPRIYQPCKKGLGGRLKLSQILKPSRASDIPRIYQPCKKGMGGRLKLSQILKPSHAPDIPPYRRSGPRLQRSIIVPGHFPERTSQRT